MIARTFATSLPFILVLAFCDSNHAAPVRIAYSSISAAMLPLFVAKDKRLFDKYGVDVDITYIRGVSIEALIAGEVQFVRASPPAVVRSTLRGADLAVIANTINVPVFSLMTRADLRRPEDLNLKTAVDGR
jgi:ABC-type nitrate/sulfonate/bicarbonate transport system substrate-binding protein